MSSRKRKQAACVETADLNLGLIVAAALLLVSEKAGMSLIYRKSGNSSMFPSEPLLEKEARQG